jgi:hypothetical protein
MTMSSHGAIAVLADHGQCTQYQALARRSSLTASAKLACGP